MAREERRKVECDDGSTFASKHGSRGALNLPAGLSMWKPKKSGTHQIDIIPFVTTEERNRYAEKMQFSRKVGVYFPHRIYRVHYDVGAGEDAVACSARNFGHTCPVCQKAAQYREHEDAESEKKANELNPKERSLFLVYDRDETEKGVQLWEVAWYNFGRHIQEYIDGAPKSEQQALKVYYHPTQGFTIRVHCKETPAGKGRPYTDFLVHSMSPRITPVPEEIYEHGYDLDAMVREMAYDKFKALFTGEDAGDDDADDDDQDDKSAKRPAVSSNGDGDHDDAPKRPTPGGAIARAGAGDWHKKSEPAPKWIPATGDVVSVEFKGEEVTGEVVASDIDGKLAKVKIEGREHPVKFDFSDLTLVEQDDTFDKKSDTSGSGEKPGWSKDKPLDDDDDDGRSFKRKPAPVQSNDDDGDEPTPPKKKKK